MVPPRIALMLLAWLAGACASAPPRPTTRAELTCANLKEADGSMPFGDFLEVACSCGGGAACEVLAVLLEKEGGASNLEAAAGHRARACQLGVVTACASPARAGPSETGRSSGQQ